MSGIPPEGPHEHVPHPHEEQPQQLPAWVPALIGLVLVSLAGLAVYTGLRYRTSSLVGIVKPRKAPQATTPAPPGEPEPGASLIFPGDSGDTTPTAGPAVKGPSRAVISGSGTNVIGVVRAWARRGMSTRVVPDDAVVYVNNVPIGEAKQFAGPDEIYDFPAAGSYVVKIAAPGYKERTFVITAADDAKNEIARLELKLDPQ